MPLTTLLNVDTYYREYSQTVAARTSGVTVNVDLGFKVVDEIAMLFAQGHVSVTGFRVLYDGKTVIPWDQPGVNIIGNNERRPFSLGLQVQKPLVFVFANNDNIAHTFFWYIAFREVPIPSDNVGAPALPLLTP